MTKIVIVGGAGFVGHHLALALGQDVTCIDSLTVNNLFSLLVPGSKSPPHHVTMARERLDLLEQAGIPIIVEDARDYHRLSHAIAPINPDIIVHLAAVAHIDRANKDPWSTFDNSLRTLENSLDVARAVGAGFVYFSSSTVYGNFSQPVINEDELLTPIGIYGNLKLAGERMCIAYHQSYGMPLVIVRPQALYGSRCVSGRVTQLFIERAIEGKPITIHGDGTDELDFTYISDLIQGMRLILDNFPDGMRIYNLTGESASSLGFLAHIVTKRFPTEIRYDPLDPEKPARGTMSCERIRTDLGYEPRVGIQAGMNLYMDAYNAISDPKNGPVLGLRGAS
ncbi:MAG TPA: NAD(P)-dependent oxidoreductase [Marinobacter sp.]|uniref:NAD-dependent epimerase/dehydratase domain-containing protein n=1 Tax=marine sediment metagenome TaxID=412755 RepID=A0A0F9QDB8_9ZZZZ|nr:NAD(P)-dependent oxidoreductase [Marinobacter sp.]